MTQIVFCVSRFLLSISNMRESLNMIKNQINHHYYNNSLYSEIQRFKTSEVELTNAEIEHYINYCNNNDYKSHYLITLTQDRSRHTSDKSKLLHHGRYIANVVLSKIHRNIERVKKTRPAIYIGFIENAPDRTLSTNKMYLAGDNFWHIHMIVSVHDRYKEKAELVLRDCIGDDDTIGQNHKIKQSWYKLHRRGTIQIIPIGKTHRDLFNVLQYSSSEKYKFNNENINGFQISNTIIDKSVI